MKKTIGAATALVALLVTGLAVTATAGAGSSAGLREFEGKVVSVNRDARTFRLKDRERGTATIRVNRRTRFDDLSGFGALRPGLKRVEADVKRVNGAWIAREVELSGRDRGDDDRGGDDDRRGDDDDRGDDHGGDRHDDDDDSGGHGGNSGPGGGDDH